MAFAQTTITVTSALDTLDTKVSGECTLPDALVVADEGSNPVLTTTVEQPSGNDALTPDCSGDVSGAGSPFTIALANGATYTLNKIDNYWFGPDGLPPISAAVTIEGNGATIARSTVSGTPFFRFFYVSGGLSGIPVGNLTLEDLTLSGGLAQGGGSDGGGGGAGMGGAIFDQGALALERVTLSDNLARGGSPNNPDGADGTGGGGLREDSPGSGADENGGGGFGGAAPGQMGGGFGGGRGPQRRQ